MKNLFRFRNGTPLYLYFCLTYERDAKYIQPAFSHDFREFFERWLGSRKSSGCLLLHNKQFDLSGIKK